MAKFGSISVAFEELSRFYPRKSSWTLGKNETETKKKRESNLQIGLEDGEAMWNLCYMGGEMKPYDRILKACDKVTRLIETYEGHIVESQMYTTCT